MQNAMTFDDLREKEETTSHILSSISSYICKFSTDGVLEWCNQPEQLVKVVGADEAVMRTRPFSECVPIIPCPA